ACERGRGDENQKAGNNYRPASRNEECREREVITIERLALNPQKLRFRPSYCAFQTSAASPPCPTSLPCLTWKRICPNNRSHTSRRLSVGSWCARKSSPACRDTWRSA